MALLFRLARYDCKYVRLGCVAHSCHVCRTKEEEARAETRRAEPVTPTPDATHIVDLETGLEPVFLHFTYKNKYFVLCASSKEIALARACVETVWMERVRTISRKANSQEALTTLNKHRCLPVRPSKKHETSRSKVSVKIPDTILWDWLSLVWIF